MRFALSRFNFLRNSQIAEEEQIQRAAFEEARARLANGRSVSIEPQILVSLSEDEEAETVGKSS